MRRVNSTSWKPGQSGNPNGRPLGARQRFTESFMEAMADDFAKHGAGVIAKVRKSDPASYLRVVASLQPKELVAEVEASLNSTTQLVATAAELQKKMRGLDAPSYSPPQAATEAPEQPTQSGDTWVRLEI